MLYYTKYSSTIGELTIVSDKENIIGVWIEGQKYFCNDIKEKLERQDDLPIFIQTKNWLDRYFRGEKPEIKQIHLNPRGGEFRQIVWKMLCEIPYGNVTTYGEIAKKVAKIQNKKTMSAQAVGGAVAHNPISIIIPCHRVIGANGSLTGYAGGIDIKAQLLKLEKGAS